MARIISLNVKDGSIIHTDSWAAYMPAIEGLNEQYGTNYIHKKVNHSVSFVTKEGVSTNTIEGTWNGIKMDFTSSQMRKEVIDAKLIEFVWRRQNQDNLWDAFIKAICAPI